MRLNTSAKKHLKHLKTIANICNILIKHYNICVKHMQHPDKHIYNLRLKKKQMKHLEQTFATYVYNHCNKYNICMKHLQHTSETSEIFEMYTGNMHHIPVWLPPSTVGATAVAGCNTLGVSLA